MLMTERKPEAAMPWRGPDHRQAVGQRRPGAAPGLCNSIAKFDHAAGSRDGGLQLGKIGWRIAIGQLDAACHTNALLHRRHQKAGVGVMDRPQQLTRRVRSKLLMIAALERQRRAIAERAEQIGRPWSQSDHHMAAEK